MARVPSAHANIPYILVSDLVLALYLVIFIWNLHPKLQVKVGLAILMGLVVIATIAFVFQTVATPDFTFDAPDLVYWYMTENWAIIIAACVPTLGPLYQIITGRASAESFQRPSSQSSRSLLFKFKSFFSKSSSNRSAGYEVSKYGYSTHHKEGGRSTDQIVSSESHVRKDGHVIMATTGIDVFSSLMNLTNRLWS